MPPGDFSHWYDWNDRSDFPDCTKRGVYALALKRPDISPVMTPGNIFYIGETHGRSATLRKRLRSFYKSGSTGNLGHAGGLTYFKLDFDPDFDNVYFAVLPCGIENHEVGTAWICFKERELIWNYADKHGRLPACNSE